MDEDAVPIANSLGIDLARAAYIGATLALSAAAAPALAHSGGGYVVVMRPGIGGMSPRKDQI